VGVAGFPRNPLLFPFDYAQGQCRSSLGYFRGGLRGTCKKTFLRCDVWTLGEFYRDFCLNVGVFPQPVKSAYCSSDFDPSEACYFHDIA
jgi:hypothetical protein